MCYLWWPDHENQAMILLVRPHLENCFQFWLLRMVCLQTRVHSMTRNLETRTLEEQLK